VYNIIMDLTEIGSDDMTQDRDQLGSCGHGNELSGSVKCWEVLE
jgi:hypothetical protein